MAESVQGSAASDECGRSATAAGRPGSTVQAVCELQAGHFADHQARLRFVPNDWREGFDVLVWWTDEDADASAVVRKGWRP